MSILTTGGIDLGDHISRIEGVGAAGVRELEIEAARYVQLYIDLMAGHVKGPEGLPGNAPRYMGETRTDRREWGEIIPEPILPSDILLQGKPVSSAEAFAVRQYVKCLLVQSVRRAVMHGALSDNDNEPNSALKLEQVAPIDLPRPSGPLSEQVRAVIGDVSGLPVLPRLAGFSSPSPEFAISFDLSHDAISEAQFYYLLLDRQLQRTSSNPLVRAIADMPVALTGLSHMRESQPRSRRFGVIEPGDSAVKGFVESTRGVMEGMIGDRGFPCLSDEDQARYIAGAMPWQILGDFYKMADRPRVMALIQEECRRTLCTMLSRSVQQSWRPRDPLDDWDDWDE